MNNLVAPVTPRPKDEPLLTRDLLDLPFRASEKPSTAHRIGVEAEKFGFLLPDFAPLPYEGERSIQALLLGLARRGFHEERETAEGPVIALSRDGSSVTLEPGGQFELSGAPQFDLHAVAKEIAEHYSELAELSAPLGIVFCSSGFHPLAARAALPWVPKLRYAIMREYLPSLGNGALDMMQRTATIQVNFDYSSERDALRKLRLLLRISPLVHAMTANSPLYEGHLTSEASIRGDVWTRMDPSRSGLLERLWSKQDLSYDDYIEWALDSGMFLFKRNGEIIANTGQTFRDFLRKGFQGHQATLSDWRLHLNTLFPEVRLKNTLEVRACDAQPAETMMGVPALWVGLLYDDIALEQTEMLTAQYNLEDIRQSRKALIEKGYGTYVGGNLFDDLAKAIIEIAMGGLQRRAKLDASGKTEEAYLLPLSELVERRMSPGMALREKLSKVPVLSASAIVNATRVV